MTNATTTQQTIMTQINARELNFAKFKLMISGGDTVTVKKGKKALEITYNPGTDLYDVTYYVLNNYSVKSKEKQTGIEVSKIRNVIENFFPTFEYVMEGLRFA